MASSSSSPLPFLSPRSAPSTPPKVSRPASPSASRGTPAKRRRARAAATVRRLWLRTRWTSLLEAEGFVAAATAAGACPAPGSGAPFSVPPLDLEEEVYRLREIVAGLQYELFEKEKEKGSEKENEKEKGNEKEFSLEEVQAVIEQLVPGRIKQEVAEARKEWEASVAELRKKLERVTEENQALKEQEDDVLEEKERLAELSRRAALPESELRKEVARLEAALARAEDRLEHRLGSEMDEPIVGYDRCARCGAPLDEGYEPAGSDCSASDDELAWLCSSCAAWDEDYNELRVGCRVQAHSLECDSDLNGTPGVVVSLLPESSRYGVKFEGHAVAKAVKRGNLRILQ